MPIWINLGDVWANTVHTRHIISCSDLDFKDQWLTIPVPLSASGTPALTTTAQEIIPAINEAAASGGLVVHAIGGVWHSASTLAQLNALVSDANMDDSSAARTPTAHATSHEDGGSDEIDIEAMATTDTTTTNVLKPDGAGGVAFGAAPATPPAAHDLGGSAHTADTLADLNSKVTDATLFGKEDYDANTILAATSDNTPIPLTVNASTFVGRKAAGPIAAMSVSEAKTLLGIPGTFLGLTDTPSAYTGQKQEYVQVNNAENAMIMAGLGHWGTQTKANMEAITGARSGDTCWCSTFEKMFSYKAAQGVWWSPGEMIVLENNSGGTLVEGDVAVLHDTVAYSCKTTTILYGYNVVGPVVQGNTDGNFVTIAVSGGPWNVLCNTTAAFISYMYTSTTAKQAVAISSRQAGLFATSLINKVSAAPALLPCWVHPKEMY